jgi:hypothetical protein
MATGPEQIIDDLHASEINGRIGWFYDGEWVAELGDDVNGWKAEKTLRSFTRAAEWLRDEAVRRYPESEFAKKYGRGFF